MQFLKSLRPRVKSGEITSSIRIWRSARVSVGKHYAMDGGWIEIEAVREISIEDVSPEMARDSGFEGLVDLLKTAKHGPGPGCFWSGFTTFPPTRPDPGSPGQRKRPLRFPGAALDLSGMAFA